MCQEARRDLGFRGRAVVHYLVARYEESCAGYVAQERQQRVYLNIGFVIHVEENLLSGRQSMRIDIELKSLHSMQRHRHSPL